MAGSVRTGLLICLIAASWSGPAAAACELLTRLDALDRTGQVLIEAPTAENRAALKRQIASARREGLADGDLAEHRKTLSPSIDFYLAALTLLAEDEDRAPSALWRRVQAAADDLRRRATTHGCEAAPQEEIVSVSAGGASAGGGGTGSAGARKANPAGLVVLGVGAMAIPALLLPSILVFFRKQRPRKTRREPVRYVTTILFGDASFACMVIDASKGGLRITTPERLPRAGTARIVLPDRTLDVIIRWRTDYEMGLEFERPLDEESLAQLALW